MIRAVVVTWLLAGCSVLTTPGFRPEFKASGDPCARFTATSILDFGIGGAAAVVLVAAPPRSETTGSNGPDFSAALIGLASVVVVDSISGLVGVYEHHRCRAAERQFHENQRAGEALNVLREHAWQLTEEAETAARADNCARVRELSVQIAALDPEMHDTVFARDMAVSRCMSAP